MRVSQPDLLTFWHFPIRDHHQQNKNEPSPVANRLKACLGRTGDLACWNGRGWSIEMSPSTGEKCPEGESLLPLLLPSRSGACVRSLVSHAIWYTYALHAAPVRCHPQSTMVPAYMVIPFAESQSKLSKITFILPGPRFLCKVHCVLAPSIHWWMETPHAVSYFPGHLAALRSEDSLTCRTLQQNLSTDAHTVT